MAVVVVVGQALEPPQVRQRPTGVERRRRLLGLPPPWGAGPPPVTGCCPSWSKMQAKMRGRDGESKQDELHVVQVIGGTTSVFLSISGLYFTGPREWF